MLSFRFALWDEKQKEMLLRGSRMVQYTSLARHVPGTPATGPPRLGDQFRPRLVPNVRFADMRMPIVDKTGLVLGSRARASDIARNLARYAGSAFALGAAAGSATEYFYNWAEWFLRGGGAPGGAAVLSPWLRYVKTITRPQAENPNNTLYLQGPRTNYGSQQRPHGGWTQWDTLSNGYTGTSWDTMVKSGWVYGNTVDWAKHNTLIDNVLMRGLHSTYGDRWAYRKIDVYEILPGGSGDPWVTVPVYPLPYGVPTPFAYPGFPLVRHRLARGQAYSRAREMSPFTG